MSVLWILLRRLLLTRPFFSFPPSSFFLIRCISEKRIRHCKSGAKNCCCTRYTTLPLDSGVASGTYFSLTRYQTFPASFCLLGRGFYSALGYLIAVYSLGPRRDNLFLFFFPSRAFWWHQHFLIARRWIGVTTNLCHRLCRVQRVHVLVLALLFSFFSLFPISL